MNVSLLERTTQSVTAVVLGVLFACSGCAVPTAPPPPADGHGGDGGTGTTGKLDAQRRDFWTTASNVDSQQDFSSAPLPSGFFDFDGRTCETFAGSTSFGGTPVGADTLGAADTIVDRTEDPIHIEDPVGTEGTVEVQIVALNLRAADPVTVICDGEPTEWDVRAELSDVAPPKGSLTATKEHANGGTAQTVLPVLIRLIFTNVDDPSVQRVLDAGVEGLDPVEFHATMPWVHAIDPDDPAPATTFVLGIEGGNGAPKRVGEGWQDPTRLQDGTLIECMEHFNPSGSHLHNTCTSDTDDDGIPDGVDNCRFLSNPDQEDEDDDTFGDKCDPCPADPTCPADGDQCENECVDLNAQICASMDALGQGVCSLFDCLCTGSECDLSEMLGAGDCVDSIASGGFDADQQELDSLSEDFRNLGCDRCVLTPCDPFPCEIPEFAFPCASVTCPDGQFCNPGTGACQGMPSPCDFITCPPGQTCDPESTLCCDDVTHVCEPPGLCSFINCPTGQTCNPATLQCE